MADKERAEQGHGKRLDRPIDHQRHADAAPMFLHQTERWNETFIQLWDIEEASRGHMPVWKFLAIIGKVREAVGFSDDAKLTFEVSDGKSPMQLYRAERIEGGDVTRVYLSPRPSSCKTRDRWLQAEQTKESSCCAPKAAKPCCG